MNKQWSDGKTAAVSFTMLAVIFTIVAILAPKEEPKVTLKQVERAGKIWAKKQGNKIVAMVPKLRGVKAAIFVMSDDNELASAESPFDCQKTEFAAPNSLATATLSWQPTQPGTYHATLLVSRGTEMIDLAINQPIEVPFSIPDEKNHIPPILYHLPW